MKLCCLYKKRERTIHLFILPLCKVKYMNNLLYIKETLSEETKYHNYIYKLYIFICRYKIYKTNFIRHTYQNDELRQKRDKGNCRVLKEGDMQSYHIGFKTLLQSKLFIILFIFLNMAMLLCASYKKLFFHFSL